MRFAVLMAAAVGCVPSPEPSAGGDDANAPFERIAHPVAPNFIIAERGLGVVHLPHAGVLPAPAETLSVVARPEDGAPAVAMLIRSPVWEFFLESRTAISEGGGVEFGYEEVGLPVLEATGGPSGTQWLRVFYGRTEDGNAAAGWVRTEPERVVFTRWTTMLADNPLFFLDPDSIAFHAEPGGARVSLTLAPHVSPQRFDYILYALDTVGSWMRVEVVSPSDYCFYPEAPARDTVWIRHLDGAARPRVWYHTRGC